MMQLSAVGTSGSFGGPGATTSCYLVEWEAERRYAVLLDLGAGALGPLQSHIDPDALDAVVLSHLHPDHCFDIAGLYVHRTYSPWAVARREETGEPRAPLPVWAPEGALARLTAAYHTDPGRSPLAESAHPTDLTAAFDFRDMREDEAFTVGGVRFEPFLVEHPVECYALRLTGPEGEVLTYSGDTDACPGLLRAADGADLFLCEAAYEEERDSVRGVHLTGRRAGEAAASAGAGSLVLTHIPPWTREHIVAAEAAGAFAGPVSIARPGGTWAIGPGAVGAGPAVSPGKGAAAPEGAAPPAAAPQITSPASAEPVHASADGAGSRIGSPASAQAERKDTP